MNVFVWRSLIRCPHRCMCTVTGSSSQVCQPLNYLDGQRVDPKCTQTFDLREPATGKSLRFVASSNEEDVDLAVRSARREFKAWKKFSGFERGNVLKKAANIIRMRSEELARTEVLDTGKPIYEARMDIAGCADTVDYYGGMAAGISVIRGMAASISGIVILSGIRGMAASISGIVNTIKELEEWLLVYQELEEWLLVYQVLQYYQVIRGMAARASGIVIYQGIRGMAASISGIVILQGIRGMAASISGIRGMAASISGIVILPKELEEWLLELEEWLLVYQVLQYYQGIRGMAASISDIVILLEGMAASISGMAASISVIRGMAASISGIVILSSTRGMTSSISGIVIYQVIRGMAASISGIVILPSN
ncbi:ALDH9A1 [Mytilus edulis]|uniref:ALDH9A1 n=1 Tax=Mytilus edulis TaxID=6550 RepID=A0A8S3TJL5_MYTED|nr:ALDH9A1 [Mytilus edulis]